MKEFAKPEIEFIKFEHEDIITASCSYEGNGHYDANGKWHENGNGNKHYGGVNFDGPNNGNGI